MGEKIVPVDRVEEFWKRIVTIVASLEIVTYGIIVTKDSPLEGENRTTLKIAIKRYPRQRQTHREVGTQSYGLSNVSRGDG